MAIFGQAGLRRPAVRWGGLAAAVWLPACLVFAWPDALRAADIAVLKSADIAAYNQAVSGIKGEISDSINNVVEYDMQGDLARGRKLARKIRTSDAALIIAVGLKAALAAKSEIADMPVIYCMVLDPNKHDLHAGNMTGISLQIPIDRQFAAMRNVLPQLKRIGVLYDPEKTASLIGEAGRIAKAAGMELVERRVSSEKDVPSALRDVIDKVDVLWLVPDSTILTEDSLRFILRTALDRNVPVFGFSSEFVRSGALAGLSVNSIDIGRQAGGIAKKVLKGQGTGSSNSVPPDRVRLALNLKTAKFLGLVLPSDVVGRADEVY
jgi:putative ABC transport system substrate-binding protein